MILSQQETWEGTSTLMATKSSPINYCPFLPKEKHYCTWLLPASPTSTPQRGFAWDTFRSAITKRWVSVQANVQLSSWSTCESGTSAHTVPEMVCRHFARRKRTYELLVHKRVRRRCPSGFSVQLCQCLIFLRIFFFIQFKSGSIQNCIEPSVMRDI